jgi:hypothetical protein
VGALVLEEVRARGLQVTPENQKLVRVDLRRARGPDAFAVLAGSQILDILSSGGNVLLDAIFCVEEYRYVRQLTADPVSLLAISASSDVRAGRLQNRCLQQA